MKIPRIFAAGLVAAAVSGPAFTMAGAAHAQSVLITISGPGSPTTIFELPISPPASDGIPNYGLYFNSVAVTINGDPSSDGFTFFDSGNGGGLSDNSSIYSLYGAQYYEGSEEAAMFVPGVYTGQSNGFTSQDDTVTITAVPEPATWGLTLAGFGVLGGALRARRVSGLGRLAAARGPAVAPVAI